MTDLNCSLQAGDCSLQAAVCRLQQALVPLAVIVLALSSCKSGNTDGDSSPLVVFAASSLQDVFAAEALRGPDRDAVRFNFAGTQTLRAQIEQGARADVFVSADTRHMEALRSQGLVEAPVPFACNHLVVVVPAANPAGLTRFADLPKARRIVLAASEVPAGRYAEQALDRAGTLLGPDFASTVRAHVVSRELNVRQALAKVSLGEADAAIVYRTDARAAGDRVRAFDLPATCDVRTEYLAAVISNSSHEERARAFIAALSSGKGRAALEAAGFSRCDGATAQ